MSAVKRKHEEAKQYKISTEWALNASDVREKKIIQGAAKPVPNLPNVNYHFQFHPKLLETPHITLFLDMPSNMNIAADIKVQVTSRGNGDIMSGGYETKLINGWTHFYTKSDGKCSKLCSYEDLLEKFLVNKYYNSVKVEAVLTIFDVNDLLTKKTRIDSLGSTLWENENGKDAKIIVEGKEIKVHKCVLQSRSTILNGLTEAGIKPEPGRRGSKAKNDTVGINNYKYDIVEKAVMFCYDLPCLDDLSAEDAIDLFKFADEFEMKDLKEKIEDFWVAALNVSNAVLFANSSIAIIAEKLHQKCFSFLLKCMKDGTTVKDIEKLDAALKEKLFVNAFNKA